MFLFHDRVSLKSIIVIVVVLFVPQTALAYEREAKTPWDRLNIGMSLGVAYDTVEVEKSPAFYGQIPVHPDDSSVAYKTVPVSLVGKKVSYASFPLGVSISPLPFPYLEALRIGYKFNIHANKKTEKIREGLSDIEWYRSTATNEELVDFAAVYSRLDVPSISNSFLVSLDVPLKVSDDVSVVLRGGMSYDRWKSGIEGGWDRFYSEQALVQDDFRLNGKNPFAGLSVLIHDEEEGFRGELLFNWKQHNFRGSTPNGDVELGGNSYELECRIYF